MELLQSFKDYLAAARVIKLAHLITMELPQGGNLYLASYLRDVEYSGQLYVTGVVKRVGSVKQTKTFNTYSLDLTLSGADSTELNRALNSGAYLNRKITIHRAYIDADGSIIPMFANGSTIKYFEGIISKSSIKDGSTVGGKATSTVQWTCTSEFGDFNKVNGRITEDVIHRGLEPINGVMTPSSAAKRPEYQTDKGFYHANQTVSTLAKYQVLEKRYKTKVKKNWYGGVKKIKTTEYTVLVDRTVDLRYDLTAQYIPVVYGVRQLSGNPIFIDSLVNDPNTVFVVYSICEGEIDGFLDFYISDNPSVCWDENLDPEARVCYGSKKLLGNTVNIVSPGGTGTTTDRETYTIDDGDGPIEFTVYHGGSNQAAADELVSIAAAGGFYLQQNPPNGGAPIGAEYWDSNFQLLDTAYIVCKFQLSESRNDIPDILVDVQGRKIKKYNSVGAPLAAVSTSLNPAWQILDYITNKEFGGAAKADRIDYKSFYDVAQLCNVIDESYAEDYVPYWRYVGWTEWQTLNDNRAILQCNTALLTEDTVFKNVDTQLAQIDASLNVSAGVYTLSIQADKTPVASINVNEVIGGVTISDNSSNTKYNSVQASLVDPGKQWSTNQVTFFNSEYKTEDNSVDRKGSYQFPFVTNYYTARSMAERFLKASRSTKEIEILLPFRYIDLAINDHFEFTSSRYSWDAKVFMIHSLEWTQDAHVKIGAMEVLDGMFINSGQSDISDEQLPDVALNVLPVGDLQFTPYVGDTISGKQGDLSWLPSTTANLAYYLITWTGLAENKVLQVNPSAAITSRILYGIFDLDIGSYDFSVRAVDVSGRASKASVIQVTIDPASVLQNVEGFTAVNASVQNPGSWAGSSLDLIWDTYPPTSGLTGIAYNLVIEDADTLQTLRDISLATTNYSYTLVNNKLDYFNQTGLVGANRRLIVKIKATADGGKSSASWSYL